MPNENLKKLHSAVSAEYELPELSVFEQDMQDEGKRKKFYEAVASSYELPEYETFSVDMGFGEKKNSVGNDIQPDLGSGGAASASAVQSTESEIFKPTVLGQTKIDGEEVDVFGTPQIEIRATKVSPDLKQRLKGIDPEAMKRATKIKLEKREPTPQELQSLLDMGISEDQLGALKDYLTTDISGKKKATEEDVVPIMKSLEGTAENIGTRLQGFIPRLNIVAADVWEGVFGKEFAQKYYQWEGRDIDKVRKDAFDKLSELENKMMPTRGLVESFKKGDIGGLAAAVVDATGAIVSTAIPSALTGGAGLFTEMIGESIVDYNNTKAEEKGISTKELYDSGEAELAVPLAVGTFAGGLEKLGLKGITKAINKKIQTVGTKKAVELFIDYNQEGLTELAQTGLEDANKVLAKGGSVEDASMAAVDAMFSEKGLEAYAMGVTGAASSGTIGRYAKSKYQSITGNKNKELDSLSEKAQDIVANIENPNVSPTTKKSLVSVLENIDTEANKIIEEENKKFEALDEQDKAKVTELASKKTDLQEGLNDPNLTEESKKILEENVNQIDVEIEGLISQKKAEQEQPISEMETTEPPTIRDVESINSVNPTGTVFVEYTPEQRMKAPLGENMVTLEKTIGGNPDDVITIYRGVPVGVKGEIVGGDYVTTNKQLAKDYAGDGNVIELKVKKSDVIDDKTEPAGEEYIYRPKSESLLSKPQTPPALKDVESTAKALEGKIKKEADVIKDGNDLILKHGTPHDFTKFQLEKIGTGEGQQAFGYGLYFTDGSKIAEQYAKKLSEDKTGLVYEVRVKDGLIKEWVEWREPLEQDIEDKLYSSLTKEERNQYQDYLDNSSFDNDHVGVFDELKRDEQGLETYDKQSAVGLIYRDLKDAFGQQKATEIFKRADIDGIKYRSSANRGDNFNYVVFDPNAIEIIKKEKPFLSGNPNQISEAYHKAKADGSNPELVKAVEDLLTPKTETNAPEQQSGEMREQIIQEQPQGEIDSNMPIVNEAELQDGKAVEEEVKPVRKLAGALANRKKALTAEPISLEMAILQYFLNGGKIYSEDSYIPFTKDSKEYRSAKSIISNNPKDSSDMIAQSIISDPNVANFATDEMNIADAIQEVMRTNINKVTMLSRLKDIVGNAEFIEKNGMTKSEFERFAEEAALMENVAEIENDIVENVAERVEKAESIFEGLTGEEIKSLEEYLAKFEDADGNVDWSKVENDRNIFWDNFAKLEENIQKVTDKLIENERQQRLQNQDIAGIDAEKPTAKSREALSARLAEAKTVRAKAELDYNKAKESFDKDAKERQGDMFQGGQQKGLIDDLAEKQAEVDRRKKVLDEAIENEKTIEGLLEDKLEGQQELNIKDKRQELLDKVKQAEEELKKQNKKRDDFYDNDFVIFDPKSRAQTDIDLLAALGKYVKAKLQLASYDFKTFLSDIKTKGIELSKDGEAFLKDWFADIEKTAVKGLINKETGVTRPKPTEQKRIDKAYALGVADTKADFKAKLDELKSDFKEFLSYTEGEAKKAIQAAKDKGAMLLDQERYMKKQITSLISSALDKDFISQKTFDTIINRLGKAKTPNQYQKLFDYILKAADQANYAERMAEVSKLQKQAKDRNHTSMQKVVNDFVNINPENIPDNLLPQYIQALDELSGRVPKYTAMMDIYYQVMAAKPTPKQFDEITTFEKAQELYDSIALNKVGSIEEYRALFQDINGLKRRVNQLIENETDPTIIKGYEDILEQIGKDQGAVENKYASEIATLKTEMINELRKSMNSSGITNLSKPEKELLSRFFDLDNNDLRNLSPEELYNLQSIMDNVREDGYLDVFRLNPLVIKAENSSQINSVANQINKAKNFKKAFNDRFEALRKLGATYGSFWESALGLGSVEFGAFTKNIVVPMERAIGKYRRQVNEGYAAYRDLKKKHGIADPSLLDRLRNNDKALQMTRLGMISAYLREYAMQFDPEYAGKKDANGNTLGTRDWFEIIIKTPQESGKLSKEELDKIEKVWNKLPKVNGKVDVKAVYDSYINGTTEFLDKNEIAFLKDVNKWKEENITPLQKYANELRGKGFNEVLFHIKRIRKGGDTIIASPVEKSEKGNIRIAAGSGKDVTNNNVGAIETDFEKLFAETVEESARDFHITPMLQQQSDLLKKTEQQVEGDNKEYVEVARENLKQAIEFEFEKTQSEFLERIARNLMKAKASQVLIAPLRTVNELFSSAISYPLRSKELGSVVELFKKRDAVRKLMEITDSPFLSKADLSKHFDVRDGSIRGEDMFSRGIQFFAAMPERVGLEPVWMASFSSQFLKETGVEFDRKEFVSNPSYATKYKKAIQNSAAVADTNYSQIAGSTTQAGSRRNIKILPSKIEKAFGVNVKANTISGQMLSFFTNYPFREVEQGIKSARALVEVAKNKEYDYKDGLVATMPLLGSFLGALYYQYSQALVYNLKEIFFADDDEEKEKANKELNKLTSAEGILNESIAAVSSVGSTRYSGVSKALIQLTGTVIYNFTDDEEVKKKAKSLTRDITFKNPFEIKRKKDGDVVGYGMRDKITAEIAMYLPPLATAGDNVYKVLESLGGYPYLYNKALNGEVLSEPEKEALVLAQLFVNASNAVLMFSGGAIPFSNEINKFAKKETKGKIKETEVTEKDVIETEVTPNEIR